MITVKEIARMAGVSAKTAERALSGVSKDKRRDARDRADRVRRIAAANGYRPSELALSLRRGSIRTVGFLVDVLTDQFLAAAAETAMDEAARFGFRVALRVARFSPEQTEEALQAFLASGVDGIITSCTSAQLPAQLMSSLIRRKFPVFSLCGRSQYEFSSSGADYGSALPDAVRCLAERGHRRVTCCMFTGKTADNAAARRNFLSGCEACGVTPDFRVHTRREQAAELAEEGPDALILYGKYSMRIYLDRCAELRRSSDVVGIYNEWTLAAAQPFDLCGIILENAEAAVRGAVRQVLDEVSGAPVRHLTFPARFVPEEEFHRLKVVNLANQLFAVRGEA